MCFLLLILGIVVVIINVAAWAVHPAMGTVVTLYTILCATRKIW